MRLCLFEGMTSEAAHAILSCESRSDCPGGFVGPASALSPCSALLVKSHAEPGPEPGRCGLRTRPHCAVGSGYWLQEVLLRVCGVEGGLRLLKDHGPARQRAPASASPDCEAISALATVRNGAQQPVSLPGSLRCPMSQTGQPWPLSRHPILHPRW